jgi:hypothetical protein
MRLRSTGLGKTEMVAVIGSVKRVEGHLFMTLEAIEPVRWHTRTVLTYKDIIKLVRVGTFSILAYLMTGINTIFKTPPSPKDY